VLDRLSKRRVYLTGMQLVNDGGRWKPYTRTHVNMSRAGEAGESDGAVGGHPIGGDKTVVLVSGE
jgi:hypothetical protein